MLFWWTKVRAVGLVVQEVKCLINTKLPCKEPDVSQNIQTVPHILWMLFKQLRCPKNASSWTCHLGYSQSTSRPLNLYSLSSSIASYTNWFIRYTLDVSSLNGVDPNAHPPIASRICNRVTYSIHRLCVFIIHWISSQGSWQGVVLHLGGSVVG